MPATSYLTAIILGLVVGVLARLVVPGKQQIGSFVTVLIGIGAALLGTFLSRAFGVDDVAMVSIGSLKWSWAQLAIQVGLGVVGIVVAAALVNTFLTSAGGAPRRRTRRRRSS